MKETFLRRKYDNNYYKFLKSHWFPKFHMIKYVQYLMKNKNKNIKWLDIGCSIGYLIQELLDNKIQAYGIDISIVALGNILLGLRQRVVAGSIVHIPYKTETFDVVSAFDVIEHIHPQETELAFRELNRVLKTGGYLFLTTPNSKYMGNWIYDLTHINVRPPMYWKIMLKKHGFKSKREYIPSFLKYYIKQRYNFYIPIPNKLCFFFEEPLRFIFGKIFSWRSRLYIFAKKL
ncbi:MAG TPA: class I SAM-dependent methyltransferase [Candidatus Atribacteria bacterium]|nr:class I SAM-dependent methyltransferase [Candidatus Atribacteria bacterium]